MNLGFHPGRLASQWPESVHVLIEARRPDLRLLKLAPGVVFGTLPDDARVLLARPFAPAQRQAPPPAGWPFGLRWIQLVSVGFDFYPRWLLDAPGVLVSTAHGSSSATIADFVLASILRVQLRLAERRAQRADDWRFTEAPGLAGSRVALLGFGGIGQALAGRLLALGLHVKALRRSDAPLGLPGVERARDLADLLAGADHLVLLAPGTAETRHIVDAAALARAKPGLHLVNVARGSLVEPKALRAALDSGRLGWASLDVTEPEPLPAGHWLYQHPRVWLTPHTCAISPQVQQALVDKLLRSLDRLGRGEPPESLIELSRGY
jgi:phosphoglycerate dehydrogenase-like enzyme